MGMLLKLNPKLKNLKLVPFQFAAYDTTVGKMAFFDKDRKADFVSISGTKMRKLAKDGETPPDGFMHPSGWKILVDYYQRKARCGVTEGSGNLSDVCQLQSSSTSQSLL